MEELSIHDNSVNGYSVNIDEKRIILHTEFREQGKPFEKTDVIFEGVEGYLFFDSLGGILFDISEIDIDSILNIYESDFKIGAQYGWPGNWIYNEESIQEFIKKNHLKTWNVSSSIGFDGFVISKSMKKKKIDK